MLSLAARPDPLRLDACPPGGDSLVGLGDIGACPECGRPYDQSYVVITGQGRGQFDTIAGGTWRGTLWAAIALVYFALLIRWAGFRSIYAAIFGAILFAQAVEVAARFLSDSQPKMQLWLAP